MGTFPSNTARAQNNTDYLAAQGLTWSVSMYVCVSTKTLFYVEHEQ